MKGWKKIETFNRPFQAELRKSFLEQNDIPVMLMNENDSQLFLGEIDLYVEEHHAEKAQNIIQEFHGWSKLHSFIREKPVLFLKNILDTNQVRNLMITETDQYSEAVDYQLWVKHKDLQKAVELTTGLEDWGYISTFGTAQQAAYRVDILEANGIEAIVYRISDSNFEVNEYNLFVKNDCVVLARKLTDELAGWKKIKTCKDFERAEYIAKLLEHKAFKTIVLREKNIETGKRYYDIYVEQEQSQKAHNVIENNSKWTIVASYETAIEALIKKELLLSANIESFIINQKDSAFLMGEIDLYVEEAYAGEACELLTNSEKIE
jgi:hypothetical protein